MLYARFLGLFGRQQPASVFGGRPTGNRLAPLVTPSALRETDVGCTRILALLQWCRGMLEPCVHKKDASCPVVWTLWSLCINNRICIGLACSSWHLVFSEDAMLSISSVLHEVSTALGASKVAAFWKLFLFKDKGTSVQSSWTGLWSSITVKSLFWLNMDSVKGGVSSSCNGA